MGTVKVRCTVPTGVQLRNYEIQDGELGIKRAMPVGDPVELRPGDNEIDSDFWAAWFKQFENDALVKSGAIELIKNNEDKNDERNESAAGAESHEPQGSTE